MKIASYAQIEPSATISMNSLALEKKRAGFHVHNLGAGEPMIETSPVVIEAAYQAMKEGQTHYPPVAGITELRQRVSGWMNEVYQTSYGVEETIVTCGGKHGLSMTLQALLNPGDEVCIVAPYWVSYPSMVKLVGGVPKIIATTPDNFWKIDAQEIARACTPRTQILILNNAANPTGVLYSREELRAILSMAYERGLYVISDEVYSGLVYDNQKFVSCASFPQYRDRTVIIQSCSKHFAMTGWRVGFVFGPKEFISAMINLQGQTTTGTSSISQWAALAAFGEAKAIIGLVNKTMQSRRDIFLHTFQQEFGVSLSRPASGLYCFFPLQSLGIKETASVSFCLQTLAEANVVLIPGVPFGQEGYVRASFGADEDELTRAIRALAEYIHTRYIR